MIMKDKISFFCRCSFQKNYFHTSSVIRQKGELQNEGNKKTKHDKFSEKRTFTLVAIYTS